MGDDFGTINPADLAEYTINFAALTALAITESAVSEPSGGASIVRAAVLSTMSIPNTVPPTPFLRACLGWGYLGGALSEQKIALQNIIDQLGNGTSEDNLWYGPGAAEFQYYAKDQVLAGIEQLIQVATEMNSQTFQYVTGSYGFDGVLFAMIKAYAIMIAAITYQLSIMSLQAIPVVGQASFAAATWAAVATEQFAWLDFIGFVLIDVQGYTSAKATLRQLTADLKDHFGNEGKDLEQAANGVRNREHADIANPEQWGKADA